MEQESGNYYSFVRGLWFRFELLGLEAHGGVSIGQLQTLNLKNT